MWTPVGPRGDFHRSNANASGGLAPTPTGLRHSSQNAAAERHLVWQVVDVRSIDLSNGDPGSCYFGYRFHRWAVRL